MAHNSSPRHPTNAGKEAVAVTIPKVRLYVERPEKHDTWFVNVGHVADRGRWRTEPHSHPAYGQIIFVRIGRGIMNLEGASVSFEGPCALLLPPEYVHGLDYEIDVDRWVATIEVTYLAQINAKLSEFSQLWSHPKVIPLGPGDAAEYYSLIRRLEHEVESRTVGHVIGTEALLTSLLLMLVRGADLQPTEEQNASHSETRLADRFRDLIDKHYRDNLQLQDYATIMTISVAQLRAACAAATGQSPNKMIHARIITEAKRSLIFGDMTMEQISYWLGFSDAAYFTRFFRKEVGQSPSQFRIAARQQPTSQE